ncbi:homeobox protein 5 isoform X1 [Tetranychus urticae]|uniref:homeobox protein 5 isoform X1 n=1 Tax=Tetranychus urticae TaxID=32264 RepID=UPI00077BEC1B|nr:homeobox protein 5 isoform X1 [Tetranychus urticae]
MDTFLFPQPMVLSGPIVQLIQTPSGATQLVTTSSSPNNNAVGGGNNGNGGGQPVVSASSNKNSSVNSSRSTKQILPKPPGNGANSQSGGSSKHNSQANNNGSGTNNSTVNSNNNGGNHGARSLVTNMPSNVNSVGTTLTTGPLSTGPGQTTITPQILLGPPGNQKMSFITSNPPGTFLLNQVIPGLGSQPILIQGNLNNIGGPLQLTLRQQQPQSVVTVSSANGTSVSVASSQGSSTPLISTLAGQTSSSVQRSTHSTPTYLFSNHGSTMTGTTAPTMVMSGQHNFRGQNIIFTRPPNLIGQTGSMVQGPGTGAPTANQAQTVPQFIQIQTANGPMLVALQTTPTLGPPNGGSPIIQTHVTPSPQAVPITSTIMPLQSSGTVGNQNASNHPTLHTILQTSSAESLNQSSLTQQSGAPLSANSIIFSQSGNVITSQSITTSTTLTPHQHQHQQHQHQHQHHPQTPHSSSIRGNSKARKEPKGLNLADLLKETGILQDSSPPQSPSSITIRQTSTDGDLTNSLLSQTDITQANSLGPGTTPTMLDNSHANQAQPTMLTFPDQGSQASNILIAPGHGMTPGTTHQLRLSLAADGSVILQPNLGPSVSTANTILSNPSNLTNQTGTSTQLIQDLGSTSMASISNSKFIDTLRDSCGPGSSQPSPDSTTPTLDASTPTSASTISTISLTNVKSSSPAITTIASSPVLSHKQTLMQHLNAGSTMKVGDSVTSMTITPIMGPSYRDDSKSSSPFIPLTITSESIRESTNHKTTIKQESSSKSMMDHSSSESKTEIVSVPLTDMLNSNNPCNVSVTPSSSTSTSTTTLTMSNCDSLVQNPSMPVLLTNASLIIPDNDASTNNSNHKLSSGPSAPSNNRSHVLTPTNTNNSASPLTNSIPSLSSGQQMSSVSSLSSSAAPTLVDQNGFQFVQISLNNQEFIERLEAQIKNLRALKSPKEDQKKLLQELLSLQKRMSEAKIQPQSSMYGESKVILTSLSQPSHTPELLITQPQQLQQTQQQPQQLQRKPISSPGPQSLPQEIQSHLQQMFSESQHETEQHHQQQTQHTSMPSILPKTAHLQTSSQLNQPQSPNPQFNIIKLNSSTNSNQLHPNQPQLVTATQQQAQNVRLINQTNANNLDGNTTIQVGTQLITIAASPVKPSIQSSLQTTSHQKQSSGGSNATTIQVVRIGTPNTSTSSTNSVNKYFKAPLESPQLESEKTKAKICRFFQQQAAADQAAATKPDTKTPFKSRSDACKRLLRYHVFNAPVPTEEQLSKVDRDFEVISESLLKRKNELFNRFRYNLLKSNMIETPKAEYVMLNKLFINDENISLQRDKDLVAQGKELELPPPPESWKKIIRDSLEEEEQLSINRKRKSSALDEDFLADCTEIKKYDIEDRESGDTDDDEDDSEDEDDEEENAAEDIAKYLGSNHHSESVPDLGYYPDFSNNPGIALPTDVNSLNNPYTQRNGTQEMAYNNEEWKGTNFVSNNRRIDVWNNRYDNENDFAVSTILEGGENGESADHETDLDLSSIQFLDLVNCHW